MMAVERPPRLVAIVLLVVGGSQAAVSVGAISAAGVGADRFALPEAGHRLVPIAMNTLAVHREHLSARRRRVDRWLLRLQMSLPDGLGALLQPRPTGRLLPMHAVHARALDVEQRQRPEPRVASKDLPPVGAEADVVARVVRREGGAIEEHEHQLVEGHAAE